MSTTFTRSASTLYSFGELRRVLRNRDIEVRPPSPTATGTDRAALEDLTTEVADIPSTEALIKATRADLIDKATVGLIAEATDLAGTEEGERRGTSPGAMEPKISSGERDIVDEGESARETRGVDSVAVSSGDRPEGKPAHSSDEISSTQKDVTESASATSLELVPEHKEVYILLCPTGMNSPNGSEFSIFSAPPSIVWPRFFSGSILSPILCENPKALELRRKGGGPKAITGLASTLISIITPSIYLDESVPFSQHLVLSGSQ
ncbi:hypothetical protein R3P38DRAFT_2781582 [Favolaschia claudopus]|uniref:Uncharacterized protein n=1 Tax=Favolaschia claudopus TaxID=2862362 RepID=A0AAW0B4J5_9AGAR